MYRLSDLIRSLTNIVILLARAAGLRGVLHSAFNPIKLVHRCRQQPYVQSWLSIEPKILFSFTMVSALATSSGCSTPPPDLDLSLDKLSNSGRYRIAIIAPTPTPAVNQLHSWTVKLATPDGKPIKGAHFAVSGGMPQHYHGYPTQPRVTQEFKDGTYLLEGMKFSMNGWWELKLGIRAEPGPDQVTFNIIMNPKS
jgi:hypothetical protein